MENENENVKKSSKGLIVGIVVVVLLLAIGGVAAWMFYGSSSAGSYVAKVGDLEISEQEYRIFTRVNKDQFISSSGSQTSIDDYKWETKSNGETAKAQVRKTTLESLQEIKIQLIKAKEAGVKLESADLDSIDQAINQRITQSGSKAAAEEATQKDYGVSLDNFKAFYKDLMLTQKYIDAERAKVKITDDEAKKHFEDNKSQYDKATVSHILVKVESTDSEGKKAEAKKKADFLLKEVQAGADIKELALKYSDDKPGVTENKGEYTFQKTGQMVPEFENWAFEKHQAGDAAIVQTQFGYHIMQFHKRVESKFEDNKESIKNELLYTKFGNEFKAKLDAWKKDAKYEVKENKRAIDKLDKILFGF